MDGLERENRQLKDLITQNEEKATQKISKVTKNVSDMSCNLESLLPIIQEINRKYKSMTRKPGKSASKSNIKQKSKTGKKITSVKVTEAIPDSDHISVVN